jgi:hypothetical protein
MYLTNPHGNDLRRRWDAYFRPTVPLFACRSNDNRTSDQVSSTGIWGIFRLSIVVASALHLRGLTAMQRSPATKFHDDLVSASPGIMGIL